MVTRKVLWYGGIKDGVTNSLDKFRATCDCSFFLTCNQHDNTLIVSIFNTGIPTLQNLVSVFKSISFALQANHMNTVWIQFVIQDIAFLNFKLFLTIQVLPQLVQQKANKNEPLPCNYLNSLSSITNTPTSRDDRPIRLFISDTLKHYFFRLYIIVLHFEWFFTC